MHLELNDKIVLETGGTKGIGRAIVRSFLKEGATVHFCSRTEQDVQTANEQLAKDFPDAEVIGSTVDVSNQEHLTSWVEGCTKESGKIDVVVANVSSLAFENSAENCRKAFETDMLGIYTLIQSALSHLEKTKGNIVNISSGIRASNVCPGNIYDAKGNWGRVEEAMPDFFDAQLKKNPMGRMGKPEEVADAVA